MIKKLLLPLRTTLQQISGIREVYPCTDAIMVGLCTIGGLESGVAWGIYESTRPLENALQEHNLWKIPAGGILGTGIGLATGVVWPVSVPVITSVTLIKAFLD